MRRSFLWSLLVALLFFGAMLVPCAAAPAAEGAPAALLPTDDYVNDFAGIMSASDVTRVRETFQDLERQTGIEAVVVTIKSRRDYPQLSQDSIESFATALFNSWGVGVADKNNGVLFLIAADDREARIEIGSGYPAAYDGRMKKVMDKNIVPNFQASEFSRGIYEGATEIVDSITREPTFLEQWGLPIALLGGSLGLLLTGISLIRSGRKGWGWAAIAAAGVLLFLLFRVLSSNKSRRGFGGGSSSGGGATGRW